MNFTAPAFVLLFPIVLALHWMLPPSRRWVLLLAASLGFYAVGSPKALPLLAGITLGTYAAALGIAKSKTQTAKKLWLTCAAVLCIGCLCLFKYAGIFRTDVPLLLPETSSAAPSPRSVLAFCLLALTVVAAWFSTLHTGTTNAFIYFQF